jgi:fatty-acyl-CoA synthase
MGLGRPARVDSYRGFVFASMSKEGPDLMEHLGNAKPAIDRLCDLSPEGEIELPAGWLRHQARANWKMALENYLDGYHPRFVHRALVSMTSNTIFQLGNDDGPSRIRAIGNGHGEVDFTPHYRNADQELLWIAGSREKMPRYIEALEAARGKERAHELLVDGPPHTMIFPNLYLGELFIEVLEPQAPGSFVQGDTPIFWKGGAELNERNMRQTGASIGPAGMVLADDVAMWERNYKGLGAHEPEWLIRQRGGHNTEHLDHGVESGLVTYDTAIMGFWREYRDLMTAS